MRVLQHTLLIPVLSVVLIGGSTVISARQESTVTISWWHIDSEPEKEEFWEEIAHEYMTAHPGVIIKIYAPEGEALSTLLGRMMEADDPPDIFFCWGGGRLWQYAEAGLVRNIAPELEGEWKASFSAQSAVELFGRDGAYYGVPYSCNVVGMYYNKTLLAQAGLDPAHPPVTWDEFLITVRALKKVGITPIALGESERWTGHFWWVYLALRLGGAGAFLAAYDRTGSFADVPFVEAGEYLNQLIALEPFPEDFMNMWYGDQAALMGNGQAAMELMGDWAPEQYANYSETGGLGDALGWFPFPAIPAGAGNATDMMGGCNGFAVGKYAPDAAVDFLRYLTSIDVQRRAAAIWIIPTVVGADEVVTKNDLIMHQVITARNAAPYMQLFYDQMLSPAVASVVIDAVNALFAGEVSPEEAAMMIEVEAAFEMENTE